MQESKKDIVVGVIPQKRFTENYFAELTADMAQRTFDLSRISVVTLFAYGPKDFERIVEESHILIVGKRFDRDMDGCEGIDFIKRVQAIYPDKMFMAIAGSFTRQERSDLISAGAKLLLKKPVNPLVLQESINFCIKLIDM
ncbi:MAG: hypothetical protein U9O20_00880 [Patescibacteria group bacterium]|nr:hypothetical protein [Patescibacteria group bacterium]